MKSKPIKILLIRASLSLATVVCLLCVFNLFKLKQQILRLDSNVRQQTAARRLAEESVRAEVTKNHEAMMALDSARQLYAQATKEAQDQSKRATELKAALAASQESEHETKARLARFVSTSLEPEQIIKVAAELKTLRDALERTQKLNAVLEQRLRIQTENTRNGSDILLPANLKAKVLLYDPKWHFVVLDNGREQGMVNQAELLVARDGKFLGKIKVSRVEKNQSIANLVPEQQVGELFEGDLAIPAHPES